MVLILSQNTQLRHAPNTTPDVAIGVKQKKSYNLLRHPPVAQLGRAAAF